MLIGIVISGLVEKYSQHLCKGIEYMAGKDNVKCVIIPGKYLQMNYERDFGNKYGYTANSLFYYGLLPCFDGVIVEMSSTMMYASEEYMAGFARLFDNVPHVFISYDDSRFSSVSIDNKAGLREALEYMYSNGARKYAMIGGPDNNYDALSRKECFTDFMTAHQLHYDENSYRSGSFHLDCSEQIDELVRENLDADVFVCANDVLAKRVYKVCHKYNLTPGTDVSVIGFDDSHFCMTEYPTISSVRTDVTEVGKQSYTLLMETIAGRPSRRAEVPSKFVLRDSICHRAPAANKTAGVEEQFREIAKANSHIEDHKAILRQGLKYFGIFLKLDTATSENILDVIAEIDGVIDEMFLSESMAFIDWELLVNIVDKKYKANLELYSNPVIVEHLTLSYVRFLHKLMKYNQTSEEDRGKVSLGYNHQKESFFRETMHFARSTESNYARFLENMEFMGISNAYLYLYDSAISYMQDERFHVPECLYLKAVLSNGKTYNISSGNQKIITADMFTNRYVDWDEHSRLIMFPLYSENYLYGVIVCDMRPCGFRYIEMFVNQISAAIRMLQLRIENKKIMDEYEESVRTLREHNITLDEMSRTDPLTTLNNRRGFYYQYEKLIRKYPGEQESVLVCCADMNSLKIVNDRFGHEDGDFAIKTIGNILKKYARNHKGFAARMGGDEFAFVIVIPSEENPERYRQEIHDRFDSFNLNCDKPYDVCVSMGYRILRKGDTTTIDDALADADEMLYEEKRNKPNIIKS